MTQRCDPTNTQSSSGRGRTHPSGPRNSGPIANSSDDRWEGNGGSLNVGEFAAPDYAVGRDGLSPDSSPMGYDVWAQNYGRSAGGAPANAIPEPGAAALAVLAALRSIAANRRRG